MSVFWIISLNKTYIIEEAFSTVNLKILPITLNKYYDHLGSTIKIKIMQQINTLYHSRDDNPNHKLIIQNLYKMLNECDNYLSNYLTPSTFHQKSSPHHNEPFQFYNLEQNRIVFVPQTEIPSKENPFTHFPTKLIHSIKHNSEADIINLIETSPNLCPTYAYYGETALIKLIQNNMNAVAIKLIDKYNIDCLATNLFVDNHKIKIGAELVCSIRYKNEEIALKLIDTFNSAYPVNYIYSNGDSILMLAIKFNLITLSNKIIDKYHINCLPFQVNYSGETALIISCKNKHEDLALNIINTFSTSNCLIYKEDNNSSSAVEYAKNNNLTAFLNKITQ